jgi:hypothetical protein
VNPGVLDKLEYTAVPGSRINHFDFVELGDQYGLGQRPRDLGEFFLVGHPVSRELSDDCFG